MSRQLASMNSGLQIKLCALITSWFASHHPVGAHEKITAQTMTSQYGRGGIFNRNSTGLRTKQANVALVKDDSSWQSSGGTKHKTHLCTRPWATLAFLPQQSKHHGTPPPLCLPHRSNTRRRYAHQRCEVSQCKWWKQRERLETGGVFF